MADFLREFPNIASAAIILYMILVSIGGMSWIVWFCIIGMVLFWQIPVKE